MELYLCGTRGSCPVSGPAFQEFGCATSCYVLRQGEYAVVVDCGSGLFCAQSILAGCSRVDVLLSHLHYDHLLGLLHFSSFPPGARLRFFSRFGDWFGQESLRRFLSPPFWPYTPDFGALCDVPLEEPVPLCPGVSAEFRPSCHPDEASLIGLTVDGKRICFACDYEHGTMRLQDWVDHCDLLLYDGAYSEEVYARRMGWGHSTWQMGCSLAEKSGAKRLVITHHAPESTDEMLRRAEREAREVLPTVCFAREGGVATF